MRSARNRGTVVALLLAGAALSGCFTVDAKVEQGTAGRLTIVYPLTDPKALDAERKRAQSPQVVVESAEAGEGHATMKLKVADFRKLNTSRLFENVTVTADEKEGTTNLVAKVVPNEIWRNIPDKGFEVLGQEVRISVEVPGEVVETNAQEKKPNAVTWKMSSKEFFRAKQNELKVSYKAAAAGTSTTTVPGAAPAAPPKKE